VNTIIDDGESAILERAITADNESWSPEAARAILAFKLADADLRRADELAAKARSGSMTDEERQNLENYLRVGRLVEFMKAKALLSLKSQSAAA
jgi:hypothetical protein